MIVPLPDVTSFGDIVLPTRSVIQLNEGHVVAKGPLVSDRIPIGSCVLWAEHCETKFTTDDEQKKFVANEANVPMFIPPVVLKGEAEPTIEYASASVG